MRTKSLRKLRLPLKNNNELNNDGVTGKMAGGGRSVTKPVVRKHDDDIDAFVILVIVVVVVILVGVVVGGMQSTGVWSLNHDITTSPGLRPTPIFLKSTPTCKGVTV
jgi:hypothetical protein